jgi:hypothetical protein
MTQKAGQPAAHCDLTLPLGCFFLHFFERRFPYCMIGSRQWREQQNRAVKNERTPEDRTPSFFTAFFWFFTEICGVMDK